MVKLYRLVKAPLINYFQIDDQIDYTNITLNENVKQDVLNKYLQENRV